MPVATLPQAVQTATQGTHRMSEGDRQVHTTGLLKPPKPAAAEQQPGLSQRQRRGRRGRRRREQCQPHAVAGRIRRQRVLEKQRVSERASQRYHLQLDQLVPCSITNYYRVSQQVSDLGWVDLDLGCSTTLIGQ